MPKQLPKKVFVRWNDDDSSPPFLMVGENPEVISEENSSVAGGIYELTRKVNIVNETNVVE